MAAIYKIKEGQADDLADDDKVIEKSVATTIESIIVPSQKVKEIENARSHLEVAVNRHNAMVDDLAAAVNDCGMSVEIPSKVEIADA